MRYTHDLTDAEWQFIHYCFPKPSKTGRPREHAYRELLNAMFYLVRTGCQWRNLPKDFAPWRTVYHYYRQWKRTKLWAEIHTHLREQVRLLEARNRPARAAIIDSQSVKSTECSDHRGYDAGKKVNGRKRHILVDVLGLVLQVLVLPANVQAREAARQLLNQYYAHAPRRRVQHGWADGGYAGALVRVGAPVLALHGRDCQTHRSPWVQSVAAPLGGRADLRVAGPLSALESRLRTPSPDRRHHGPRRHDSPHVAALGQTLRVFIQTLS